MTPTAVDAARAVLIEVIDHAEHSDCLPPPLTSRAARALAGLDDAASASALLTVDQAAHHLAVAPDTVRRWVRSGTLPAVRVGRVIRVPAAAVGAVGTVNKAA